MKNINYFKVYGTDTVYAVEKDGEKLTITNGGELSYSKTKNGRVTKNRQVNLRRLKAERQGQLIVLRPEHGTGFATNKELWDAMRNTENFKYSSAAANAWS